MDGEVCVEWEFTLHLSAGLSLSLPTCMTRRLKVNNGICQATRAEGRLGVAEDVPLVVLHGLLRLTDIRSEVSRSALCLGVCLMYIRSGSRSVLMYIRSK